jgi:hypothetical protein
MKYVNTLGDALAALDSLNMGDSTKAILIEVEQDEFFRLVHEFRGDLAGLSANYYTSQDLFKVTRSTFTFKFKGITVTYAIAGNLTVIDNEQYNLNNYEERRPAYMVRETCDNGTIKGSAIEIKVPTNPVIRGGGHIGPLPKLGKREIDDYTYQKEYLQEPLPPVDVMRTEYLRDHKKFI